MRRERSREQKLVDILFQCVATVTSERDAPWFQARTQEERMAWVAQQLKDCGFPTVPCGGSWGVLVDKELP